MPLAANKLCAFDRGGAVEVVIIWNMKISVTGKAKAKQIANKGFCEKCGCSNEHQQQITIVQ